MLCGRMLRIQNGRALTHMYEYIFDVCMQWKYVLKFDADFKLT